MVFLLVLILLIEFFFAYYLSGEDIVSPPVIFSLVFLCAAMDLMTMIDVWSVELHVNTVMVVAGGVGIFILTICLFGKADFATGYGKKILSNKAVSQVKEIQKWKLYVALIFNILIVLFVAYKVVSVVRATGYSGNALACIGRYSHLSKFTSENLNIGKAASNLHQLCEAEAYIWGYVLIDEWFEKKKISCLIFGNFIVTTISYFLYGSRSGAVFVVISLLPAFVMKYRCISGKKRLKRKYIVYAAGLVFVLMFSFQSMGAVINRKLDGTSMWEYISIYLGAPLLNLDSFLQENHSKVPVWGYNTFATQINYLGAKFGMMKYNIDIPFRSVNGHNLGNVYTTFYSYIMDFGYGGMIALTAIMSLISQIVYKKAQKSCKKNKIVNVSILLYMYIFPFIAFSFFSNKFYEGFGILFIKSLVYWATLPYFLYHFRVRL